MAIDVSEDLAVLIISEEGCYIHLRNIACVEEEWNAVTKFLFMLLPLMQDTLGVPPSTPPECQWSWRNLTLEIAFAHAYLRTIALICFDVVSNDGTITVGKLSTKLQKQINYIIAFSI
jgi:hypothetical protein